jgi:adenylosuccinate lyase
LKADERVSAHLGPKDIDRLVDPANYLGAAGDMTVRLLELRRR